MKNAHLRLGSLEFTKGSDESRSRINVHMDRFVGEHPKSKGDTGKGHLLSVFGNDQDISAIWSAITMEERFTVQGPEMPTIIVTLGKDPQTFRGSISSPGWKRPVRHLVAISNEVSQTYLSDDSEYSPSIICDSDPVFILYRLATRFGLPVMPEWTSWFVSELNRKQKVHPLVGLGCRPTVVYGTKQTFMKWISSALKQKRISIPTGSASICWKIPNNFVVSVG